MTAICPHCQYDLKADTIIERDGFTLDPRGAVTYNGQEIKLTKTQKCILFSLAKANGRRLSSYDLADRCCYYDASNANKEFKMHISLLRKRLSHVQCPVQTDHGVGYYWQIV